MPTTIGILTKDGLVEADYVADTLAQSTQYEPDGIYTVASTFRRNYALLLDAHLDRMEESAQLEKIPLNLDRDSLRLALRTLIERSGYENSRFRITVPRQNSEQLIITLEPFFGIPPNIKQDGVVVSTVKITRRNPKSKTSDWMTQREAAKASMPSNIYEGIIMNEVDELLEGFGSNFYAVFNGRLYTADDDAVLGGISRKIVFEIVPKLLPLQRSSVRLSNLPEVDEAFLTSSSRGIIPIIQINDVVIGDGKPGTITQQLIQLYDEWVNAHIEPI